MRKKLNETDKKVRVTITLDRTLNNKLDLMTINKSKLIEILLIKHLKDENL